MFLCEFCEIFKKTYIVEHLWTAASVIDLKQLYDSILIGQARVWDATEAVARKCLKKIFLKTFVKITAKHLLWKNL